MSEQKKRKFLELVDVQAELNKLAHGERERNPEEWAMIAVEHIGHLSSAVLAGDHERVKQEILHVAAPLMELYVSPNKNYS